MRLELFIAELLFDHDCVIVPDFGGFVATYRPARLNTEAHLIYPPTKQVGFNRHLSHNDGLLVDHIARQTGLTYTDASKQVADYIRTCKLELQNGGRFVWQKVGVFFHDATGQLQFIPDDQQNFLQEAYGWNAIQLTPVQKDEHEDGTQPVMVNEQQTNKQHFWWKAAAVLLPIGIAGTLLVSGWARKNNGFQMADLNPFASSHINANYPVAKPLEPENVHWSEQTPSPIQIEKNTGTPEIRYDFTSDSISSEGIRIVLNKKPIPASTPNVHSVNGKYEIIGGAFMFEDNADKLVSQLKNKGYNAHRAGNSKGLFLVAIGSYNSSEEASKALQTIRLSENKNAWMRVR